jgi:hypothetical protein
MSPKPVYEIDGSQFATLEGFFEEVSRVLVPSARWGHNLDAFNDILRGGFGTREGGFVLQWKNSAISRERLSYPETARQLQLRLMKCHPANRERVEQYLDDARKAKGPTVFDWLLEIIRVHEHGGREEEDGVELVLDEATSKGLL